MVSKESKPHLTELSRNNNVPSESELQEAFELRSKLREDLLQIDTEIRRLKEQRGVVQKSIDTYNLILSPARRLLPEILQDIFYHCLPTGRNPVLSATEAPMLLTRVCSIWRAIALTSPRIWARLHIALPGNPALSSSFGVLTHDALAKRHQVFSKVMELRCRVVKDWLTRSGTCPLSISLSYPLDFVESIENSGSHQAHDLTESIFRLILSFSPRWKSIDLSMPFSIYKKLEFQVSGDHLPLLCSWKVNFQWSDMLLDHIYPLPVRFLEAPNLQRLSLNASPLTQRTSMFPPIWGRLTDLHFQSTILDVDFFNIIQLCHNLVTCQVGDIQAPWHNPEEEFRPQTEVLLPNLEMMKINETGGVTHVFQVINMPCLKSLSYRCPPRYHEPYPRRADVILTLVEKGVSTIRKLTLEPQNLRPEDTVACLRLASEVSHLVFGCSPSFDGSPPSFVGNVEDDIFRDDFFDLDILKVHDNSSTAAEPQDIILPKLEVLEVNDVRKFTDEGILGLLANRINAARRGDVSPLRRLKLQISRQKQRDIRNEAHELAESAGFELKLDLIYPPEVPPYNGRLSPSFSHRLVNFLEEPWPPMLDFTDG